MMDCWNYFEFGHIWSAIGESKGAWHRPGIVQSSTPHCLQHFLESCFQSKFCFKLSTFCVRLFVKISLSQVWRSSVWGYSPDARDYPSR